MAGSTEPVLASVIRPQWGYDSAVLLFTGGLQAGFQGMYLRDDCDSGNAVPSWYERAKAHLGSFPCLSGGLAICTVVLLTLWCGLSHYLSLSLFVSIEWIWTDSCEFWLWLYNQKKFNIITCHSSLTSSRRWMVWVQSWIMKGLLHEIISTTVLCMVGRRYDISGSC